MQAVCEQNMYEQNMYEQKTFHQNVSEGNVFDFCAKLEEHPTGIRWEGAPREKELRREKGLIRKKRLTREKVLVSLVISLCQSLGISFFLFLLLGVDVTMVNFGSILSVFVVFSDLIWLVLLLRNC